MENLTCPYCGAEMERGYLYAPYTPDIYYLTEEQGKGSKRFSMVYLATKTKILYGINRRYGILRGFRNPRIPVHHCKNCHKIILLYSEK